jgi:hypothetical protein
MHLHQRSKAETIQETPVWNCLRKSGTFWSPKHACALLHATCQVHVI